MISLALFQTPDPKMEMRLQKPDPVHGNGEYYGDAIKFLGNYSAPEKRELSSEWQDKGYSPLKIPLKIRRRNLPLFRGRSQRKL